MSVTEPISPELRDLDELKRLRFYVEKDGERAEYVTAEFHEAWSAELRARWQRDIDLLKSIDALLTEAKTKKK